MLKQLQKHQMIKESFAGELYEYFPLGEYVVIAPAVCGGRPTFKYTRLEVSVVLADLAAGYSVADILDEFELSNLSSEAIQEAGRLATL